MMRTRLISVLVCSGIAALVAAASATAAEPASESIDQAYAERYGVSLETASQRLALQDRAAGLPQELEEQLGEDFAGLWFDNERGEFVVPVVNAGSEGEVREIMSARDLGGEYRTEPVQNSFAGLISAQEDIVSRLDALMDRQKVQVGVNAQQNATIVSVARSVSDGERETVADAVASFEGRAQLRTVPDEQLSYALDQCTFPYCDKPLRGGVSIDWFQAGVDAQAQPWRRQSWCSNGFLVYDNVTFQRYIATAGHCLVGTQAWWSRNHVGTYKYIGPTWSLIFGPAGDAGIIRVNSNSGWLMGAGQWVPGFANWGTANFQNVAAATSSWVGAFVCRSGAASGVSCGPVQAKPVVANYAGGQVGNLTQANLCATGGDSGGSYFAGNTAFGIHSGSTDNGDICTPTDITYYSDINIVLQFGTSLANWTY